MLSTRHNQSGFSALVVAIVLVISGVVGLAAWQVMAKDKTLNQQTDTNTSQQVPQLSIQDAAILKDAKQLKTVDFDLDGVVNSQDNDIDNDGQDNDVDNDNDNDGQDNDVDNDNDNDGVADDKDNEADQQAELQKPD